MTCVVLVLATASLGQSPAQDVQLRVLFDAIRTVETGGEERPEQAVGDGGRSLGPYQISRKYLADSGVSGDWRRCRDVRFSETVMLAYWKRHCPEALRTRNFEILARIHNGGPTGHNKAATAPYWKLVRGVMNSKSAAKPVHGGGNRRRGRALVPQARC